MTFLIFSVVMFSLMIVARYRTPEVRFIRPAWFACGLLPSELPWLFGFIQLIITIGVSIFSTSFSALMLSSFALSLVTLVMWYRLHLNTFTADEIFKNALDQGLKEQGDGGESAMTIAASFGINAPSVIAQRAWLKPFYYKRPRVERISNISYGSHPRQQLDLYRPAGSHAEGKSRRPVLLHVHGGGWIIGNKNQQAKPLINYLTLNGWLCVDINYRLAPKHRFPDCLVDVKTAITWIKNNI